jgi:oxygen-independent coproporphyrinogen-3 oxidase
MDPRLFPYAEQNAPRYTSYPTAPHFQDSVTGETMARWLSELPADATVSLYLHIPYCRDICWYCGCHTFAAQRDEPLRDYVAKLIEEIGRVAAASNARKVKEIHWGGGTPNILSSALFRDVMDAVRAGFDLSGLHEHAIELDPRSLTALHCVGYKVAGVNRASLGVQDVNPRVQQAIGRIQPLEVVASAFNLLRAALIENINADLMYGLPHQTLDDVRRSASEVAALEPSRIAAFGYAHVPWFKTRQRLIDEAALPGTALRMAQVEAIRETLEGAGYVALGFDHFAKPDDSLAVAQREGRLKRNFQGYVDDDCDALIGIGASAISTLPQGYAQNPPDIATWGGKLAAGGLPTARGRALTDEDRVRRALIERILCDFEVDLSRFGGVAAYAGEIAALAPLAADGLWRLDGARLIIPEDAQPVARVVAQAFDAYRDQGAARHSRAV